LPVPASRLAAVPVGPNRVIVLGGLVAAVVQPDPRGPPGRLRRVGTLPIPTHDDAAVLLGSGSTCSVAARRPRATPSFESGSTAAPGVRAPWASRCPTSERLSSAARRTSPAATRARSTPPGSSRFAVRLPSSRHASPRVCATQAWPRSEVASSSRAGSRQQGRATPSTGSTLRAERSYRSQRSPFPSRMPAPCP
jgi:hypothetical protein